MQKIKTEGKNKAWCCSPVRALHCRQNSGVLVILSSLGLTTHGLKVNSLGFSWAQDNSCLTERQLRIHYQLFPIFSEENVLRESNITTEQRLLKWQSKHRSTVQCSPVISQIHKVCSERLLCQSCARLQ